MRGVVIARVRTQMEETERRRTGPEDVEGRGEMATEEKGRGTIVSDGDGNVIKRRKSGARWGRNGRGNR